MTRGQQHLLTILFLVLDPNPVNSLTVSEQNTASIQITWSLTDNHMTGIRVTYNQAGADAESINIPALATEYLIEDLLPGYSYHIVVTVLSETAVSSDKYTDAYTSTQ